jgi:hypothetical protein
MSWSVEGVPKLLASTVLLILFIVLISFPMYVHFSFLYRGFLLKKIFFSHARLVNFFTRLEKRKIHRNWIATFDIGQVRIRLFAERLICVDICRPRIVLELVKDNRESIENKHNGRSDEQEDNGFSSKIFRFVLDYVGFKVIDLQISLVLVNLF